MYIYIHIYIHISLERLILFQLIKIIFYSTIVLKTSYYHRYHHLYITTIFNINYIFFVSAFFTTDL